MAMNATSRQENNESDREIVLHDLLPTAAQRAGLSVEFDISTANSTIFE